MKKIRLGIFGLGRGSGFADEINANGGEVVALCDRDSDKMTEAAEDLGYTPAMYTDFDEFINHDMDAVFLSNCFHEHAPFAIRCLEKGIHVLSECTSNLTMAEGVALVRAAQKSKAFYMLSENYPFMLFNQEMRRVYKKGYLGKVLYADGEYNHPFNMDDKETHKQLRPYPEHWRNYLPRSYYITHSLAPLMYATGAFPKRVSAFAVFEPFTEFETCGNFVGDRAAVIMSLNDDNSVFKFTGCAAFGAHGNSYRICGTKGQIENLRGQGDKVTLRFNDWEIPEGFEECSVYEPELEPELREAVDRAGHGGGDFFVMKEFFDCIRENRKPEMDEYFATTCASVAILSHRSLLEKGVPYDIPDFHNEEDCVRYENDTSSPFLGKDGSAPEIPCCSVPDFKPDGKQYQNYLELVKN